MGKLVLKLGKLGRYSKVAIALGGIVGKEILMIVFGDIKTLGGDKLGYDSYAIVFKSVDFGGGYLALLLVGIKNHRSILRANIIALAVVRGGVMNGKKNVQQLICADDMCIKIYLNNFHVPCRSCADGGVIGGLLAAAHIA